jgi:hypothetical protein
MNQRSNPSHLDRRELLTAGLSVVGAHFLGAPALAQEASDRLYLHPTGADTNPGSKERPLKTLAAAARRVNQSTGTGPMTIILSEGVHAVDEPALFKPAARTFSKENRLTIRAEVLPDEPAWSPQNMPILMHTMPLLPNWLGRADPFGGVNYGMQFETSHVTVQGLKILGTPHLERPNEKTIRRVYPIAREGADLDDLEVRQCLFVGNREVAENHCAVLARGHGVVIDRCVFHGCKITVVFWTANARGCAMRNTLTVGNYVTGAWVVGTGEDFEFRNNVMSGNMSAVLFQGAIKRYNLASSLFAGNTHLYGAGNGPAVNFKPVEASALALPGSSRVTERPVQIQMDQARRDYLHVIAGTEGADIGAGLLGRS